MLSLFMFSGTSFPSSGNLIMIKYIPLILMLVACSDDFGMPTSSYLDYPPPVFGVIRTYEVPELTDCVVMKAPPHTLIRLCGDEDTDGSEYLDVPVGTECVEILSTDSGIQSDPRVLVDKVCK